MLHLPDHKKIYSKELRAKEYNYYELEQKGSSWNLNIPTDSDKQSFLLLAFTM